MSASSPARPLPIPPWFAELSLRFFSGLPAAVLVHADAAQALIEVMAFVLSQRSLHLKGVYEGGRVLLMMLFPE